MTLQVENLRHTYDRNYDNLMTNRKIFFCNLAPGYFLAHWFCLCIFVCLVSVYAYVYVIC